MEGFCGAGDSNSFKEALRNYQYSPVYSLNLPKITYEGVFQEHFYQFQKKQQQNYDIVDVEAFQSYSSNIFTYDQSLWTACLFQSNKDGVKREEPIDISLVLDISGSMSSPLSYDPNGQQQNKMQLAKKAIQDLLSECLISQDSFGLATFNTEGQVIQSLQPVSQLNLNQLKNRVDTEIQINGGTTVYAGLKTGINMFLDSQQQVKQKEKHRQKRILLLTDMIDMNAIELEGLIRDAAENNIYVSVIGIGVDFNNQITDVISKNRGCNYFSITKDSEMRQTIVDSFSYNFFPIAYNVDLKMQTEDFQVLDVYGSPFGTAQNENLSDNLKQFRAVTEINTLFPCSLDHEKGKKGGLILIKLKPNQNGKLQEAKGKLTFSVNYTLSPEKESEVFLKEIPLNIDVQSIENKFNNQDQQTIFYQNQCILKGVLLQKYVEICKQYGQEKELEEFSVQDVKNLCQKFKNDFQSVIDSQSQNTEDLQETKQNLEQFMEIIIKFKEQKTQQQK